MKRRHLFEFNEAAWSPFWIRNLVTDYLATLSHWLHPFSAQLPLMVQALKHAGDESEIIDLCSGGGGPWQHLGLEINQLAGREISVWLTDIYPPDPIPAPAAQTVGVRWHAAPVDATAVPDTLRGMRTLFNGFHHFRPETAAHILHDAVSNDEPIVVMELLRRDWEGVLLALFSPLLVLMLTPWIRPFSWKRLVLTYLIPVAPLVIWWDTLVSILRCYTPQEMRKMGHEVAGDGYHWFADTYRCGPASVTFLIGYPRGHHGSRRA